WRSAISWTGARGSPRLASRQPSHSTRPPATSWCAVSSARPASSCARHSRWTQHSSAAPRCRSATTSSTRQCTRSWSHSGDSSPHREIAMTDSSEITDIIKAKIKGFQGGAESVDVGTVVEIGDGIARVYGLANCMASELLDFGDDVFGLAFNLEEDTVSAIILGDYTGITEGGEVRTTGRIAETPVGDAL